MRRSLGLAGGDGLNRELRPWGCPSDGGGRGGGVRGGFMVVVDLVCLFIC